MQRSNVELIDQTNYLNHYYLISLLSGLLIFLPAHRGWSLDAWRKPELRVDAVPAWTLNLLRFQIGIVYFFAGVAKLNTDWLFRAQPLGIWLAARSDLPVIGHWLGQHWVAYGASWFGAVFDLSIVFFLLWKRSRALAYLAVIFFHLMTLLLFNIGMFPWVMMVAATVFFAPEWARRFISKANIQHPTSNLQHPICFAENMTSCFAPCSPSTTSPRPSPPFHGGEGGREPWDHSSDAQYFELFYRAHPISAPTDRMRPGLLVALGIYATIQLALPLRSFFCSTPAGWSYAGFNCAWRVMIVEKTGYVEFHAFDPVSARRWTIPIEDYLTPRQEALMAQDPDLIRQMARHLAADLESRGFKQIQIHADAFATMNGRPSQRLIDPNVNLALSVPQGWIVPMVN